MAPVVIEFLGLPGSGKSTIANALIAKLKAAGYRCPDTKEISRIRKNYLRKFFGIPKLAMLIIYVRYFGLTLRSFLYAVKVKPLNAASMKFASGIPVNFFYQQKMKADYNYDFILLDQGILQNTWSVSITGIAPPTEELKKLLKKIPVALPSEIFLCNLDVDMALHRIKGRKTFGSRFDRMPEGDAKKILGHHVDKFLMLAKESSKLTGKKIFPVNAATDLQKNTEEMFNYLSNLK